MVDPVEAEELELIQIRSNFQNAIWEFWVEALEAFTDVTKLVEAFGLETVLLCHIRFSKWEDSRQISVSIILMSHVL